MSDARKDQPAIRIVETPKRSSVPYLVLAFVAAILVWSYEQQDNGEPDHH